MNYRMNLPVAALAALQVAIWAPAALAEDITGKLIGPWEGTGRMAAHYEARLQKVRCQADAQDGINKGDFQIEGTCAVAAGKSRFTLRVVADEGNKIRAAVRSQAFDGTAQFTGTFGANGWELTSKEPVMRNEKAFHVRLLLETLDNQHLGIRQWIWPDGSDKARETFFITMLRPLDQL